MDKIVAENIETLKQVKAIINALPAGAYAALSPLSASSIGQHIRHILDHYLTLQSGYESEYIDYNVRNRNSNIESDCSAALKLVDGISTWLEESSFSDKPVLICTEISVSQSENFSTQSCVSREFCYLLNHSIHHMAYIKLLAKDWDIAFAANIGIAPGTASYIRQQNAA